MVICGGAGGWKIIEMWQWWENNKNVMFVVVEGKNRNVSVISKRKKRNVVVVVVVEGNIRNAMVMVLVVEENSVWGWYIPSLLTTDIITNNCVETKGGCWLMWCRCTV